MIGLEDAMRATEVLLGLALLQASAEHMATGARVLFGVRAVLAALLIWGGGAPVVLGAPKGAQEAGVMPSG